MASTRTLWRRWAWGLGLFALFLLLAWRLENLAPLLILSFLMAYVLNPLVTRLSSVRYVNRAGATVITLFVLTLLIFAILFVVIPDVVEEAVLFAKRLPGYLRRLQETVVPWLEHNLGVMVPLSVEEAVDQFRQNINRIIPRLISAATNIASTVFGGTFSVVATVAAVVMFPMFLFFLLKDFPVITGKFTELVPERNKTNFLQVSREIDKSLSAFLHGQFMVMLVLGTLYSVGYSIVGVPVALGLGMLTGALCFVPYVGAATGFVLALLMSILAGKGAGVVLGVVVVFASVQLLDAVLITPRIIGGQLGLSPLWIVIALMAGGELFGFMGVLLAVPTTAVLKVLVGHTVERYKQSVLYRESLDSIAPSSLPPDPASDKADPKP